MPKGHRAGSGPIALILTKNRSLARQHQAKVLEYARGTLDVAPGDAPVDPCLQVGLTVGEKKDGNASREADKVTAASVNAAVIVGTLDKVNAQPPIQSPRSVLKVMKYAAHISEHTPPPPPSSLVRERKENPSGVAFVEP